MHLHWHRRDLRVADNRALAAADGPVVPAFVLDPTVLEHASPPRVAYLLDSLSALREQYRERGGDLLVRRGDPRAVLPDLVGAYGADAVSWNRDYSGLARRRDRAVRGALEDAGVETTVHDDALLHDPGTITTNEGSHYSVFSYFWRKWRDREKTPPVRPPDEVVEVSGDPIPPLSDLGVAEPTADLPPAGPRAARERLDAFCEGDVYRYDERRDYPADDATSRLSPHLRWGTVGIRAVHERTERAKEDAPDEATAESVTEFQRQLAWREFYAHVLEARPDVVAENFRDYEHDVEWREDPEGLQAWKDGETGYPIVDAGMRQLRAEAWMHNRVRMLAASFLTKDMLLDWRRGYDWFRRRLVDHDPANDSGGWQWAAGTGTDAQPYFRVFNPMTQGERYDPDAEYITEHVPELRGVPPERIHAWHELDDGERTDLAPDYPAPIVEHAERREAAIAMFERARGEGE
ncbi:MAG: deoxyribodipyrimidine photo-lyase [Halobacteriales archaeon]